jgi:hypothetical protein
MTCDHQPRPFDVVPPLGGFTAVQPPEGSTTSAFSMTDFDRQNSSGASISFKAPGNLKPFLTTTSYALNTAIVRLALSCDSNQSLCLAFLPSAGVGTPLNVMLLAELCPYLTTHSLKAARQSDTCVNNVE